MTTRWTSQTMRFSVEVRICDVKLIFLFLIIIRPRIQRAVELEPREVRGVRRLHH